MTKPKKVRLGYYTNTLNLPDGSKDDRLWIVSIDKTVWASRRQAMLANGIKLKRVSAKSMKSVGYTPVVVNTPSSSGSVKAKYNL